MEIFVLVSTLGEGIVRVADTLSDVKAEDGIRYVVVWQTDASDSPSRQSAVEAATRIEGRTDAVVVRMEGHGLSRSRNRAMEVAKELMNDGAREGGSTDAIFVIADDDEIIEDGALAHVRALYNKEREVDIALLRARRSEDGSYLKDYPDGIIDFRHRSRKYFPCSVEITMRSRVCATGLRFDERFGLGSDTLCAGEEDVFLYDAVRRGLKIVIADIDLCRTKGSTTGDRVLDAKVLRSKGAVYGYELSLAGALVRCVREALSLGIRNRVGAWRLFTEMWNGVKYVRS